MQCVDELPVPRNVNSGDFLALLEKSTAATFLPRSHLGQLSGAAGREGLPGEGLAPRRLPPHWYKGPYALTPNTVELISTLGALPPRGGPVQDPVLTSLVAY